MTETIPKLPSSDPTPSPESNESAPIVTVSSDLADPDDIELARLKAQTEGDAAKDEIEATEQEEPAPPKGKAASEPDKSLMIPKARLDEVLDAKSKAEQDAAYWKGVAAAQATALHPPVGDPGKDAAPLPQDRIKGLEAEIDAAWSKADEGELSLSEARKKEREIASQIRAIEEEMSPKKTELRESDALKARSEDLYLTEKTEELKQAHPYVGLITDAQDWTFLRHKALTALQQEGANLTPGPRADLMLRQRMAELTDVYGPSITGKALPKDQSKPNHTQSGMSPTAQARAEKLALAERQPPDTGALGRTGMKDEITEADINSMSEEDIAALPESVRRKFLNL